MSISSLQTIACSPYPSRRERERSEIVQQSGLVMFGQFLPERNPRTKRRKNRFVWTAVTLKQEMNDFFSLQFLKIQFSKVF